MLFCVRDRKQEGTQSTLSCSVLPLVPQVTSIPPQRMQAGCSQDKGSEGLGNSLLLDGVQEMSSLDPAHSRLFGFTAWLIL